MVVDKQIVVDKYVDRPYEVIEEVERRVERPFTTVVDRQVVVDKTVDVLVDKIVDVPVRVQKTFEKHF